MSILIFPYIRCKEYQMQRSGKFTDEIVLGMTHSIFASCMRPGPALENLDVGIATHDDKFQIYAHVR